MKFLPERMEIMSKKGKIKKNVKAPSGHKNEIKGSRKTELLERKLRCCEA